MTYLLMKMIMINKTNVIDDKILLLSVFGKVGQSYFIQPCIDPETGMRPECTRKTDTSGLMVLTDKDRNALNSGKSYFIPEGLEIEVKPGTTYDLNKLKDRCIWQCIKNSSLIANDRYEKDSNGISKIDGSLDSGQHGDAVLYISRPEMETMSRINSERTINQAKTIIFDANRKRLEDFFVLLGFKVGNKSEITIQNILLQEATNNPERIIELSENKNIPLLILINKGLDKKEIAIINGSYMFGTNNMGNTPDAVVDWIKSPLNRISAKQLINSITGSIVSDKDFDDLNN